VKHVKSPEQDRAAGFATAVSARGRPQQALSTAQPSRPYQQLAARPQQCAMSTRAFALFDSSSKSQNWFPVVRISLCLTLICLLNFHVARPHPPKKHVYLQVTYPIFFLLLQIISGFPSRRTNGLPFSPSELAVIEALKLAFNVLIRYRSSEDGLRQSPRRTVLWDVPRDFEEQPLHGMDSQECVETNVPARGVVGQEPTDASLTAPSWLTVVSASIVWASTTYIVCPYCSIVRRSV
jgi:hypothetical protein